MRSRCRRIVLDAKFDMTAFEIVSILQILIAIAMMALGLYLFVPTALEKHNIVLGEEEDF